MLFLKIFYKKPFKYFKNNEKCKIVLLFAFVANKAGYMVTLVMSGWAGAMLEKVTRAFKQELNTQ